MEDFYRKEGGARKLLAKEKKDCSKQGHLSLGGKAEGLIRWITSSSFGGWGESL